MAPLAVAGVNSKLARIDDACYRILRAPGVRALVVREPHRRSGDMIRL